MTSIKAIIFDLGKVVFDLSFDRTFDFWAKASGKQINDIKNNFRFDGPYEKFEIGELTPEQFRLQLSQQLNISLPDKTFDEGWCNLYLDTYKEIDSLLADLKNKFRLVALTNTNEIHETVWTVKYAETLQNFEKVFSSHHIKARKPNEPAHKIVLDYLKLEPKQSVFIDDNAENITGAGKLGIHTILALSPGQVITDLQKILGHADKAKA